MDKRERIASGAGSVGAEQFRHLYDMLFLCFWVNSLFIVFLDSRFGRTKWAGMRVFHLRCWSDGFRPVRDDFAAFVNATFRSNPDLLVKHFTEIMQSAVDNVRACQANRIKLRDWRELPSTPNLPADVLWSNNSRVLGKLPSQLPDRIPDVATTTTPQLFAFFEIIDLDHNPVNFVIEFGSLFFHCGKMIELEWFDPYHYGTALELTVEPECTVNSRFIRSFVVRLDIVNDELNPTLFRDSRIAQSIHGTRAGVTGIGKLVLAGGVLFSLYFLKLGKQDF